MDFQVNISEDKKARIRAVFQSMMTEDIPNGFYACESYSLAKDWLKHNKVGVFVAGEWMKTNIPFTVVHSCSGEKITEISLASEENLLSAVEIALHEFGFWNSSNQERAELLINVAQNIEKHRQTFALLESITTGKPIRYVRSQDIPLLIQSFYHAAGWAALWDREMTQWSSLGVVYVIASGSNYPSMSMCWHVAAALAAGNTVILQVDPSCCLSASLLAHIIKISGIPDGVFNLLPQIPSFLSSSNSTVLKSISKIFFTGLYDDAEKLRQWSKSNVHEVDVEIHAPYQRPIAVILEGADVDSAVAGALQLFCYGDPRSKNAGCRVLVQDSIKEKFTQKLMAKFSELRVGDCLSNCDISSVKMNDICDCPTEEQIKRHGAQVLSIKNWAGASLAPSLVYNIQTSSLLMHKKVGGHLLLVLSFRTMKEAAAICNHERSGCNISVWCEKGTAAMQLAHSLKTANVWINCQNVFDSAASYGSAYRSGNAVSGGRMGILHFVKSIVKEGDETVDLSATCNEDLSLNFWNDTFQVYYGGSFKYSDGNTSRIVYNGENEEIGVVPDGSRKDIRNAVECANSAQPKWQNKSGFSRAQVLYSVARTLKAMEDEFCDFLHAVTPYSIEECIYEVALSVKRLFYWASLCDKQNGLVQETEMVGKVFQSIEPLGVVGIVCPDDLPLASFVSLVAPVIAIGNSAVVVPSEKYPFLALKLCQVFQKCDVPGGVVNVITGSSQTLAKELSQHMEVEAIWVHRNCNACINAARNLATKKKNVWISRERNWKCTYEGKGIEFFMRSTYSKTIWMPMGDIFAN